MSLSLKSASNQSRVSKNTPYPRTTSDRVKQAKAVLASLDLNFDELDAVGRYVRNELSIKLHRGKEREESSIPRPVEGEQEAGNQLQRTPVSPFDAKARTLPPTSTLPGQTSSYASPSSVVPTTPKADQGIRACDFGLDDSPGFGPLFQDETGDRSFVNYNDGSSDGQNNHIRPESSPLDEFGLPKPREPQYFYQQSPCHLQNLPLYTLRSSPENFLNENHNGPWLNQYIPPDATDPQCLYPCLGQYVPNPSLLGCAPSIPITEAERPNPITAFVNPTSEVNTWPSAGPSHQDSNGNIVLRNWSWREGINQGRASRVQADLRQYCGLQGPSTTEVNRFNVRRRPWELRPFVPPDVEGHAKSPAKEKYSRYETQSPQEMLSLGSNTSDGRQTLGELAPNPWPCDQAGYYNGLPDFPYHQGNLNQSKADTEPEEFVRDFGQVSQTSRSARSPQLLTRHPPVGGGAAHAVVEAFDDCDADSSGSDESIVSQTEKRRRAPFAFPNDMGKKELGNTTKNPKRVFDNDPINMTNHVLKDITDQFKDYVMSEADVTTNNEAESHFDGYSRMTEVDDDLPKACAFDSQPTIKEMETKEDRDKDPYIENLLVFLEPNVSQTIPEEPAATIERITTTSYELDQDQAKEARYTELQKASLRDTETSPRKQYCSRLRSSVRITTPTSFANSPLTPINNAASRPSIHGDEEALKGRSTDRAVSPVRSMIENQPTPCYAPLSPSISPSDPDEEDYADDESYTDDGDRTDEEDDSQSEDHSNEGNDYNDNSYPSNSSSKHNITIPSYSTAAAACGFYPPSSSSSSSADNSNTNPPPISTTATCGTNTPARSPITTPHDTLSPKLPTFNQPPQPIHNLPQPQPTGLPPLPSPFHSSHPISGANIYPYLPALPFPQPVLSQVRNRSRTDDWGPSSSEGSLSEASRCVARGGGRSSDGCGEVEEGEGEGRQSWSSSDETIV